jgi:hypothetical protein
MPRNDPRLSRMQIAWGPVCWQLIFHCSYSPPCRWQSLFVLSVPVILTPWEKLEIVIYLCRRHLKYYVDLNQLIKVALQVVPLYCFDPRQFILTPWGNPKTGSFRAQFLLESVLDLRQQLLKLKSNLIVRFGLPEQVIKGTLSPLYIPSKRGERAVHIACCPDYECYQCL